MPVQIPGQARPYDVVGAEAYSPQNILQAQGMQTQNALRGLQVQQETQAMADQNALRNWAMQPGSTDPNTGAITPVGFNSLARINPKIAADLRYRQSQAEEQQSLAKLHGMQTSLAQQKVTEDEAIAVKDAQEGINAAYKAAEKKWGREAAIDYVNQYVIPDRLKELGAGGRVRPQFMDNLSKKFNPDDSDIAVKALQTHAEAEKMRLEAEKESKPVFHNIGVEGHPDQQQLAMINPSGTRGGFTSTPVGAPMTIPAMGAATIRAENAPAKSPYTNVQPDGKGGMIGLNTQTGQVEQLPMAPGAQSKGSKEGLTVADKMNPVMLATVKLDITEGKRALDFMKEKELDEASPFYANPHPAGAMGRLAQKLITPEKQQVFDVYANKLGQVIASAQSMGRGQISDRKIEEATKSIPAMGDSKEVREIKMQQLRLFFKYVEDVLKTPIKADARTSEDDQQDVNDFSHLWK